MAAVSRLFRCYLITALVAAALIANAWPPSVAHVFDLTTENSAPYQPEQVDTVSAIVESQFEFDSAEDASTPRADTRLCQSVIGARLAAATPLAHDPCEQSPLLCPSRLPRKTGPPLV
jgi:hypothetical protein